VSKTELQCKGVSWGGLSGQFSIKVTKSGLAVAHTEAVPPLVRVMPVLLSAEPATVTAMGGGRITLGGAGFDPRRCYRCRFRDSRGSEALSGLAEAVNATAVVCTTPAWPGALGEAVVALVAVPEGGGAACDASHAFSEEVISEFLPKELLFSRINAFVKMRN
jgi:hypothetical protein